MKFVIDGYRENDKNMPSIEDLPQAMEQGTTEIHEPTELGEVIRELNSDILDKETRMSGIDMRSRLHYVEVSGIVAIDSLVGFRMLPTNSIFLTRSKKRNSVSLNGEGRNDIVKIVGGKHEQDAKVGASFADRVKGLFGGGQQKAIE